MNILLLGGTGYLGGNIARHFLECGCRVICTVRPESDYGQLEDLGADIVSSETGQIELVLRHGKIDWIINSTCSYKTNGTLYHDMLESNVFFPLRVLNLAVKYGVPDFMTLGTGLPDDLNAYSFMKAKFSDFGQFYSMQEGVRFADMQLEMCYGGEGEPETGFLKSCRMKMESDASILLTNGRQKRDLIRAEDAVGIMTDRETDFVIRVINSLQKDG